MDLTQSIFTAVLRALPGYRAERASFRTWLYRIAANKVIDARRRGGPVQVPLEGVELPSEENFIQQIQDRALLEQIERWVSGQDGGEQAVFIGADFDGIDATPRGIAGVQDMERLYDALLARNYPDELVGDIFYGNLLRILERTGATQEESTR